MFARVQIYGSFPCPFGAGVFSSLVQGCLKQRPNAVCHVGAISRPYLQPGNARLAGRRDAPSAGVGAPGGHVVFTVDAAQGAEGIPDGPRFAVTVFGGSASLQQVGRVQNARRLQQKKREDEETRCGACVHRSSDAARATKLCANRQDDSHF